MIWVSRGFLGVALGLLMLAGPASAQHKNTLVIGLDISDGRNYDTARTADLTPALALGAVNETLFTLAANDLVALKPMLATSWELTPDHHSWRVRLRDGVKFWDGSPMTAEDVKFSLDRVINIRDQPSTYAANLAEVRVVDPLTIQIGMKNPNEPLLIDLTAPTFAVLSKKMLLEHGGVAEPGADQADKATQWLNGTSAGTGPYRMVAWERNVSVDLRRNPNYWGDKAPFERIVIRHLADGAAQLLSVRRGDIDIAMNLSAEQLDSLKDNADVSIVESPSIDTLYFILTSDAGLNPVLARPEARQAVAAALDYDGLIKGLVGGYADRPASFLPIGIAGTTAEQTKVFGFHEDLAKARQLLAAAGEPDGFTFEIAYPSAAYFSTSYAQMVQKMQGDLARVGIKVTLHPMDNVNWRTAYNGGKLQATFSPWNSPSSNPYLWTGASVQRMALRSHYTPTAELLNLVASAAAEIDPTKQATFYERYQRILVDNGNFITMMQPIYRVAVHRNVTGVLMTPNVWKMELAKVRPAS